MKCFFQMKSSRFSLSPVDPTWVEGSREVCLDAYRQVRDELRRRVEARFALDLTPVP